MRDIEDQLVELWEYHRLHPAWNFLIPPLGEQYSGYRRDEMQRVWDRVIERRGQWNCNAVFLRGEA